MLSVLVIANRPLPLDAGRSGRRALGRHGRPGITVVSARAPPRLSAFLRDLRDSALPCALCFLPPCAGAAIRRDWAVCRNCNGSQTRPTQIIDCLELAAAA